MILDFNGSEKHWSNSGMVLPIIKLSLNDPSSSINLTYRVITGAWSLIKEPKKRYSNINAKVKVERTSTKMKPTFTEQGAWIHLGF